MRCVGLFLAVYGLLGAAVACAHDAPTQAVDKDAAFAAKLDTAAKKDDFVGLAVGVVRGGDVTLLKTYGLRAEDSTAPVTPDTLFRIASLSKGFAASLTALEVADGKIDWDQPVADKVPQFRLVTPAATQKVTVETVLSQSIGLPPYAYDNMLEAGVDPDKILGRYGKLKLICPVGSCYTYQNTAFNMIAKVLEKVEGKPFEDLMQLRIFDPLQMHTASYGRDGLEESGDWARPHVRYRDNPWHVTRVDDSYYNIPAAGGINASITDMTLWLKAQMGDDPQVLPQDVLDEVHSPVVESRAETRRWRTFSGRMKDSFYGLGWRIYDYAGHQVISHTGGVRGYMAQIAFLPESDVGIVILANSRGPRTGRILPTFLDMELGLKDMDWLMLDEDPS